MSSSQGEPNDRAGQVTGNPCCPQLSARAATPWRHRQQPHGLRHRNGGGGGGDPLPHRPCPDRGHSSMSEEDQLLYLSEFRQLREVVLGQVVDDSGMGDEDMSADLLVPRHSASVERAEVHSVPLEPAESHYAPIEPVERHSVPVEPVERHSVPVEPAKTHPVPVEPVERDPVPVEPVARHSVPVEPVERDPVPMEPVERDPVPMEPVERHSVPVKPVERDSVPVEPVERDSVPVEPVERDSVPVEPAETHPVPMEPAQRDSVPVEPVDRDSVPVEPAETHPVLMEPAERQNVPMEPAERQNVPMEPAQRLCIPVEPAQRPSAYLVHVERQQAHRPGEDNSLLLWPRRQMSSTGFSGGQAAVHLMTSATSLPSWDLLFHGQKMDSSEGGDAHCTVTQSETVTLKDKNEFIQNVSQFFNQEDISDVVLKVGDNSFFAHRFVLAKSSEVFRTMLYDKRYGQAGHPEILLEESEECQRHFEAFLKFLYTAEVQICVESAVGILCLADKYSVMSLKALCTRYMVENTQSPRVRNALNWYSWAKALHLEDLMDSCSKTIAWNMEQLVTLPEWLQMDMDFLADIISNPQLVIPNEYLLYTAVEQWLLHDSHVADLKENCKKLLQLVHFPQMMVQQLYKVETGQLASREGSQEEISKLLNEAYRFRSLCPFQTELELSFKEQFYRPRNYKDLTVDTVRMQNTLRFGIQVDVRTYVGPVPSTIREGEWKITYRKTNESWTLQVYCHESAMVNGEARIQAVLLISDDDDRVLRVEASEETVCSRGNSLTMVIHLPPDNDAKLLTVLIKPLPN